MEDNIRTKAEAMVNIQSTLLCVVPHVLIVIPYITASMLQTPMSWIT